ncbi:hypothetical protein EQ718_06300 [Paracoccus versutus]|nr:hypothetical protein EQ718_06300 [Paracoccus versutus]
MKTNGTALPANLARQAANDDQPVRRNPQRQCCSDPPEPSQAVQCAELASRRWDGRGSRGVGRGRSVNAIAVTGLGGMLARKPPMLVRVALANKIARIVWTLMAHGDV